MNFNEYKEIIQKRSEINSECYAEIEKIWDEMGVLNKTVIMFSSIRHSLFYAVSLFLLSNDIGNIPIKS